MIHSAWAARAPLPRDRLLEPRTAASERPARLRAEFDCDVLVVGGGINGAGIARDAAGRGLSVLLCEKDDLATHTSSSSTKLIHGGLRYLEYYEFSLVREALIEREVLLRSAPHIIWPLRFVMPHDPEHAAGLDDPRRPVPLRPPGAARGAARLAPRVDLRGHAARRAAEAAPAASGFAYSDGWVDDARLVVLNALDARAARRHRAARAPRCIDARRGAARLAGDAAARDGGAARQVQRPRAGQRRRPLGGAVPAPSRRTRREPQARCAWSRAATSSCRRLLRARPRLHLPEPRQAHRLRHPLRGRVHADRHHRRRAPRRRSARRASTPARPPTCASRSTATSSAPVRPGRRGLDLLRRAPAARRRVGRPLGRDARLLARARHRRPAPLLSVWGGKITTYRKLAEEAADLLGRALGDAARRLDRGAPSCPAATSRLDRPAQRPDTDFERFVAGAGAAATRGCPSRRCAAAWRAAYGSARRARCWRHGGRPGRRGRRPACTRPSCTTCTTHEWARSADDVLWRRTKLGLHYGAAQRDAVAALVRRALATPRRRRCQRKDDVMELTPRRHRAAGGRGRLHLYPLDLTLVPRRGHRAAGRHAGRQDHADARDGRARRAQRGPRAGRRRAT